MLDLENLALWAAQDALLTALRASVEDALGVTVDLGQPDGLRPEHVWIDGGTAGTAEYDESGIDPSREAFKITINVLCSFAGDYPATRARFREILAGVTTALSAAGFYGGAVDLARPGRYQVDEGRDGEGRRQLGAKLEVDCDKWSG